MTDSRKAPAAEVERRRRMAAIFGDPLPDVTRDECAEARGDDRAADRGSDDWLRNQVPPHHG